MEGREAGSAGPVSTPVTDLGNMAASHILLPDGGPAGTAVLTQPLPG